MLDITVRRQAETAAHAAHQQREDLIASIDGTGGHIDVESEVDRGTVFASLQKPFSPSALAHKVREVLDAPGRATRSQSDINA